LIFFSFDNFSSKFQAFSGSEVDLIASSALELKNNRNLLQNPLQTFLKHECNPRLRGGESLLQHSPPPRPKSKLRTKKSPLKQFEGLDAHSSPQIKNNIRVLYLLNLFNLIFMFPLEKQQNESKRLSSGC
jgi:hypothetical protein